MNHYFRVLTTALLVFSLTLVAFAKESSPPAQNPDEGTPEEVAAVEQTFTNPSNIFPLAEELGSSQLTKQRDEYLKKRGMKLSSDGNKGGAWIGWGESSIKGDGTELDFGKSRIAAYEQAYTQAKEEFIKFTSRQIRTATIRKFFRDSSDELTSEMEAKDQNKILEEKVLKLAESELDQMLKDNGVDPSEIDQASPIRKRQLAHELIERGVVVESVGQLVGLRPMLTIEAKNSKGEFSVGVLVVYSSKFRQFAGTVAGGKALSNILLPPGPPIEKQIPSDEKSLTDEFGVRVLVNEKGERVLVSFGQWSPSVTVNTPRQQRDSAVKAARLQAEANAEALLTDFVNSTMVFTANTNWAEENKEFRDYYKGGMIEDTSARSMVDVVNTVSKQKGRANLEGIVSVKEWTANHPETGHLLVGKVLMWSPTTASQARMVRKGESPAEAGQETAPSEPSVRQSKDFEREDLF